LYKNINLLELMADKDLKK